MKVIIDIPEKMYYMINAGLYDYGDMNVIIKNGTPLKYNSVNCIDRDEAVEAIQKKAKRIKNADTINGLCGAISILYELPVNPVKESEDK